MVHDRNRSVQLFGPMWPDIQDAAAPTDVAVFNCVFEKTAETLPPRAVTAAMQTTIIRANMTAYSTAVGPSSFFKNAVSCLATFVIMAFTSKLVVGIQDTNLARVATRCHPLPPSRRNNRPRGTRVKSRTNDFSRLFPAAATTCRNSRHLSENGTRVIGCDPQKTGAHRN